jgi:hypothetical protein
MRTQALKILHVPSLAKSGTTLDTPMEAQSFYNKPKLLLRMVLNGHGENVLQVVLPTSSVSIGI